MKCGRCHSHTYGCKRVQGHRSSFSTPPLTKHPIAWACMRSEIRRANYSAQAVQQVFFQEIEEVFFLFYLVSLSNLFSCHAIVIKCKISSVDISCHNRSTRFGLSMHNRWRIGEARGESERKINKIIRNWTTDMRFPAFSLARGNRLSVYMPAVPNMVKERVSIKASWKHFCSSEKKGPTKAVLHLKWPRQKSML